MITFDTAWGLRVDAVERMALVQGYGLRQQFQVGGDFRACTHSLQEVTVMLSRGAVILLKLC